jgi:cell division protein FtsL
MGKSHPKNADRVLWMDRKSRKAKTRSRPRRSNLLVFVVPLLLLILSSLFFVWSRIQVIQLGYEISQALKQGRTLDEGNKRLKLEIATLKSYSRIEKIAVEDLGLSKPKPDQVVVIR